MKNRIQHFKIIIIFVLVGAGVFYFLVHPFTMVLYWFEFSHTTFSFSLFENIFQERLVESFSFHMAGMGGLLTTFGSLLGLSFSFFWLNLKQKNNLIHKQEKLLKKDVLTLIENGENDSVEFKSSIRYDYLKKYTNRELEKVIAKTIGGFMNSKGGKLIIGVDDEGNVLGLENDFRTLKNQSKDGHEREIFRIISDYLGREACFSNQVSFYELEGMEICLIDVEVSRLPVYVKEGKNTSFYVRAGNATYPLSVKETVNYLKIQKN